MSHSLSRAAGAALLAAAVLGTGLAASRAASPGDPARPGGADPRPPCCFTNPRHAGTCEVAPGKDETCASILEYLNSPQSQGKDYCSRTTLRGGWTLVPCEPEMKAGGTGGRGRGAKQG